MNAFKSLLQSASAPDVKLHATQGDATTSMAEEQVEKAQLSRKTEKAVSSRAIVADHKQAQQQKQHHNQTKLPKCNGPQRMSSTSMSGTWYASSQSAQLDRNQSMSRTLEDWTRRQSVPLLTGLTPETRARNNKIKKELLQVTNTENLGTRDHEVANDARLKFRAMGGLVKWARPSGRAGMHRNNVLGMFNTSGPSARVQLDSMQALTEELSGKIEKLWVDHSGFAPGGLDGGIRRAATQDSNQMRDHKGIEDLADRLEQYRYARHATMEVDLPPLSRKNIAPPRPAVAPGQNILERNAAIEHLRCWSPQEQAIRREVRKAHNKEHSSEVQQKEKSLRKNREARFREHLNQIDARLSPRSHGMMHSKAGGAAQDPGAALWLVILCFAQFAEMCQDNLLNNHFQGGPASGMQALAFIGKLKRSSQAGKHKALQQKVLGHYLGEYKTDPYKYQKVGYLQSVFLCKTRISRRRKQAALIWEVLKLWSLKGNLLMCFKLFFKKINHIQRFWRQKRDWLHERHAHVAKRWKELERIVVTHSLKKANVFEKNLTFAERVEIGLMPDKHRSRFIKHEMRFLRYRALPAIEMYEEEMRTYKLEVEDWRHEKMAAAAMGHVSNAVLPLPPPYISYYPSDEQIRDFIRRARQHPKNWRPIPTAKVLREHPGNIQSDQRDKIEDAFGSLQEENGPYHEPSRGQQYRTEFPSSICIYCDHRGQLTTPRFRPQAEEARATSKDEARSTSKDENKEGPLQTETSAEPLQTQTPAEQPAQESQGSATATFITESES